MTQIFFISDSKNAVEAALSGIKGANAHFWSAEGDIQVIGVVQVGFGDPEKVATSLEDAGVLILPDHRSSVQIGSEHYERLKKHGVTDKDTTFTAMSKIHKVSGWPILKPKRYS